MMKTIFLRLLLVLALCSSAWAQGLKYSQYPQITTLNGRYLVLVADPGITNYAIFWSNLLSQISGSISNVTIVNITNNTFITTNLTVGSPGGITNQNLTPNSAMKSDPNDAEASIPNVLGVLTNTASGPPSFGLLQPSGMAASGTAGTYRSVTFNAQGLETAGSNPTTFSGYGISDTAANLKSALTTYDLSWGTNLTYAYNTNATTGGNLTFGQMYVTNIAADITINSVVLGDSARMETLVLIVKNTDSAPHKVTWPGGVMAIPGQLSALVSWCTNGVYTEIDIVHGATLWTNGVTKN